MKATELNEEERQDAREWFDVSTSAGMGIEVGYTKQGVHTAMAAVAESSRLVWLAASCRRAVGQHTACYPNEPLMAAMTSARYNAA